MIEPRAALIYAMVLASAADAEMTDQEMLEIGSIVRNLPAFAGLGEGELPRIAETCAGLLAERNGLDHVISLIAESLPSRLRETAYALACEVASADDPMSPESVRLLQILRERLGIGDLPAAALEYSVRTRRRHV